MHLTLSRLLQSLRIAWVESAFLSFGVSGGARLRTARLATLHYCVDGRPRLQAGEETSAVSLRPGDYAILLNAPVQNLASDARAALRESDYFQQRSLLDTPGNLRFGTGPAVARTLSGAFPIVRGNPLVRALPRTIIVRATDGPAHEGFLALPPDSVSLAATRPGGASFVTAAFDLLFQQAVRAELRDLLRNGLAVSQPVQSFRIPMALSLLHSHPDRPWTLAVLAGEVGVSRATFAAEFHKTVGEPFWPYLTRLRMTRAGEMLKWQPATIDEVAWAVGYRSAAAFVRAFRHFYGMPPAAWRAKQLALHAGSIGGHMHWSPFLPVAEGMDDLHDDPDDLK